MPLLYHAYVYLEFLILACTIYILAPLFIDESHFYKNLYLYTKMRNVGGIAQTEAQKSSDLFMKCRYLDEITGNRGTVFATGTPVSNSMVELYSVQRYLQYDTLAQNGLQHFDSWASTFGETVTALELAPKGTNYRAKTRFAKFYNLPELMQMFREVADIQTADMLKLPVPTVNYHNIKTKPSEIQTEMVASLAKRAEKVRARLVEPNIDNMLKITNDGRKLALDQRMIDPMLPDDPDSKVNPWDRMNEEEFMQCIKAIVPNPAVQIEIETNKGSELYSSDYFDDLDLEPLLDYSWNNIKNIRKIDIDLTCEEYGFNGRGCIGILTKNGLPAEEIEILSKDVEIDGEIYTLSSNIKYKTNCITETSTSISVDEDGEIDTNTSWSERFKSKSSLSIHGIEVPYNLFPDYSNRMSKAVLKIPFPFSFRLDIGVNSDLNLNSARDQIIYDEKWLTFEENLYRIICRRLKDILSSSDWKILNEIIQKNNTDTFCRVANSFE